jgi:hypothetical protein
MLCCIFGHKIVNNKCTKCGKTICEIKGHDWVSTGLSEFTNPYKPKIIRANKRKCVICGIIEMCSEIKHNSFYDCESPIWIRIK